MRDDKTYAKNATGKVRIPSKDDMLIVGSLTAILAFCGIVAYFLA